MDASKLAVVEEIKLEPLKIVILDHGEQVGLVELEDPRNGWVEGFNKAWASCGMSAVLLSPSLKLLAGLYLAIS
jgi:hypothetical protein